MFKRTPQVKKYTYQLTHPGGGGEPTSTEGASFLGGSPRKFWKFESLKWPFPAFWDKFRTRLILTFASKIRFCKKKKFKKWGGGGGGHRPPGPPFGSTIAHQVQQNSLPKFKHILFFVLFLALVTAFCINGQRSSLLLGNHISGLLALTRFLGNYPPPLNKPKDKPNLRKSGGTFGIFQKPAEMPRLKNKLLVCGMSRGVRENAPPGKIWKFNY